MIPNEPPWIVEIDGVQFATPETVLLLLKAVIEVRDQLEAENEALMAWQRAARKQYPELEKLIAAIAPNGEAETIEIVDPPRMWNPDE